MAPLSRPTTSSRRVPTTRRSATSARIPSVTCLPWVALSAPKSSMATMTSAPGGGPPAASRSSLPVHGLLDHALGHWVGLVLGADMGNAYPSRHSAIQEAMK